MTMMLPKRCRKKAGFTLVEMLTVVGIITLLIVLATPTLVDVLKATRMTSAGDSLINRLSLAQQEAVTRNREVELRFYRWADPSSDQPNQQLYYAYQLVAAPTNGRDAEAISTPFYLESGIVLSPEKDFSPMLSEPATQAPLTVPAGKYLFTPRGEVPASSVSYKALRFYQDGSCRLRTQSSGTDATATAAASAFIIPALQNSFMTLVQTSDVATGAAPRNYYCIQVDAYTGKARSYRP